MKTWLCLAVCLGLCACGKGFETPLNPERIIARFDPAQSPPVVPTPNDLAFDPVSGTLEIPTGPAASDADKSLAAYLSTLNGYPADSPATMTFTGALDPSSVTRESVLVFDITDGALVPVTGGSPSYADRFIFDASDAKLPDPAAPGQITVAAPAGGWTSGHTYAIAVLGGSNPHAVRGAKGEEVVGSDAWALARAANSLVTCPPPYTAPSCRAATDLLPTTFSEPADRVADQLHTAIQLEAVRLHYEPTLDGLEAEGIPRAQVAQLFSFRILDHAITPAFTLDPDLCKVNVPLPNDLAIDPGSGLLATPTGCPGMTAAAAEFRTDYLNQLNGYPASSVASAAFVGGALSRTPEANQAGSGLVILDLSAQNAPVTPAAVTYSANDAGGGSLILAGPAGGWLPGHDYAVGLIGGANGLVGAHGEPVVATDQFALVRSKASLVTCADLKTRCHSALTLVPVTDDQALQLEGVRRQLQPGLDALEAQGIPRGEVAGYWSFRIATNPEVTFDLLTQTIPFPNDGRDLSQFAQPFQLWSPDGGPGGTPRVNLPAPAGAPPEAIALIQGLNTLDGFSTTAPIVSENGYATGALGNGAQLDPATVVAGTTVGLINLDPDGAAPDYQACINCALPSAFLGAADGEPEELELVPALPLEERSGYGAYVTTALRSVQGLPVAPSVQFALMRMKNPIVDEAGQLTIPELTGALDLASAQILESLRRQYAGLFDALEARTGVDRAHLALAWDFHTQTTHSALAAFGALPLDLETATGGASVKPAYVYDGTATVKAQAAAFDLSSVGAIFLAAIDTPYFFSDAAGGYDPAGNFDPAHPHTQRQQLVLTVPSGTPPANGWPVAIFGHGFTRQRLDVLALANAFAAQGLATVAYDLPLHGDRSFCVGSHLAISLPDGGTAASDDAACFAGGVCVTNPADPSYGRCVSPARSMGCTSATNSTFALGVISGQLTEAEGDLFCQAGGKTSGSTYTDNLGHCLTSGPNAGYCEGSFFQEVDGTSPPVISGWDFVDPTNFFATRDHFRHTAVDLNEVVEVLRASGTGTLRASLTGNNALDPAKLSYVGMSLGGLTGGAAATVAPNVQNLVLNTTGGNLTGLLLRSPGLEALRAPTLEGLAKLGIVPGQGNFDQFVNFAQWVLDPGDPLTFAQHLTDPNGQRKTLLQFIEGDTVVANFSSLQFIDVANADPARPELVWTDYDAAHYTLPDDPLPTSTNRHGFLLVPGADGPSGAAATTAAAQAEAAQFLLTGSSATAQTGEVP